MIAEIKKSIAATVMGPTTLDVEHGIDVWIVVTLTDGSTLTGAVTLLPDLTGGYRSWGDGPDMWVADTILAHLRQYPRDAFRALVSTIEATAAAAIAAARLQRADYRGHRI